MAIQATGIPVQSRPRAMAPRAAANAPSHPASGHQPVRETMHGVCAVAPLLLAALALAFVAQNALMHSDSASAMAALRSPMLLGLLGGQVVGMLAYALCADYRNNASAQRMLTIQLFAFFAPLAALAVWQAISAG